ncbi:hypothetical protein PoB_004478500 [Plakobranchus ocellatus]|uniref:Uncharacterized protein n=1 Tax=Plakobranchus ocellatus TaxID=259542 RepID=A0AAV4BCD1_9GAST|nr:hypothetical protein PoB_004478500 [Plakobranchus ocellatus]
MPKAFIISRRRTHLCTDIEDGCDNTAEAISDRVNFFTRQETGKTNVSNHFSGTTIMEKIIKNHSSLTGCKQVSGETFGLSAQEFSSKKPANESLSSHRGDSNGPVSESPDLETVRSNQDNPEHKAMESSSHPYQGFHPRLWAKNLVLPSRPKDTRRAILFSDSRESNTQSYRSQSTDVNNNKDDSVKYGENKYDKHDVMVNSVEDKLGSVQTCVSQVLPVFTQYPRCGGKGTQRISEDSPSHESSYRSCTNLGISDGAGSNPAQDIRDSYAVPERLVMPNFTAMLPAPMRTNSDDATPCPLDPATTIDPHQSLVLENYPRFGHSPSPWSAFRSTVKSVHFRTTPPRSSPSTTTSLSSSLSSSLSLSSSSLTLNYRSSLSSPKASPISNSKGANTNYLRHPSDLSVLSTSHNQISPRKMDDARSFSGDTIGQPEENVISDILPDRTDPYNIDRDDRNPLSTMIAGSAGKDTDDDNSGEIKAVSRRDKRGIQSRTEVDKRQGIISGPQPGPDRDRWGGGRAGHRRSPKRGDCHLVTGKT